MFVLIASRLQQSGTVLLLALRRFQTFQTNGAGWIYPSSECL